MDRRKRFIVAMIQKQPLVCSDCYRKLMAKGYDGVHYDENDECLDEKY